MLRITETLPPSDVTIESFVDGQWLEIAWSPTSLRRMNNDEVVSNQVARLAVALKEATASAEDFERRFYRAQVALEDWKIKAFKVGVLSSLCCVAVIFVIAWWALK